MVGLQMPLCRRVRLLSLWLAILPAVGSAATWYTTNDGADTPACGRTSDHACRSISQAIENASDGDTIWVGAGRYGDVSGQGTFTGPGDEHAMGLGGGSFFNASCVLCITKAVKIFSYSGTAATIIQGGSNCVATVQILSRQAQFGSKDHGFTLLANPYGVVIGTDAVAYAPLNMSITVAGNVVLNPTEAGFAFQGPSFDNYNCPTPFCLPRGQVLFAQNTVIGGKHGFWADPGLYSTPGVMIRDNLALGAGSGFVTSVGSQVGFSQVDLSATTIQLVHNLASGGHVGFDMTAPGNMYNNVASANSETGFMIVPGRAAFEGNAAAGNGGPGVIVSFYASFSPDKPNSSFGSFTHNDFYGNDRNRPQLTLGSGAYPSNPGPSAHCGVLNVGAIFSEPNGFPVPPLPQIKLPAADNFWGSATGPAASGPADAAGGACDQDGGITIFNPFSTVWFPFVPLPQ